MGNDLIDGDKGMAFYRIFVSFLPDGGSDGCKEFFLQVAIFNCVIAIGPSGYVWSETPGQSGIGLSAGGISAPGFADSERAGFLLNHFAAVSRTPSIDRSKPCSGQHAAVAAEAASRRYRGAWIFGNFLWTGSY